MAMAMLAAAPEDPEQVVGFLMKKFSGLIDRVQAAEERQASGHQLTAALESRVSAAADRRRSLLTGLQAAVQSRHADAGRAERRLAAVRQGAETVGQELRQARKTVASLQSQCDALGTRCQEERRSFVDAADMAAQGDEAWVACEVEKERLKAESAALREQLASAEEELATVRELERHRRADMRALEEKISETGRAWQAAERRAEAQHEEVCGALKTVTLYRERLDSARHALARREEELAAEDGELEGVQGELLRRDEEVALAARGLGRLSEAKAALEAVLKENAEAHEQLQASQRACQLHAEEGSALSGRQRDLEARLAAADQRLAAAAAELGRGGDRLRKLREASRHCDEKRKAMEEVQQGVGPTGEHLQSELQRVFAETEHVRADSDEALAALEDLQKRLRQAEPALEAARRRALELQETLEDADADAVRAKNRKEALMREVGQCREKMRGLRRRHSQLAERSQGLEQRLLRSSGAFGGTAGFAAAAAAVRSTGGAGGAMLPCSSYGDGGRAGAAAAAARTPRVMASAAAAVAAAPTPRALSVERGPAPAVPVAWAGGGGAAAAPAPPLAEPAATEGLGYLKQWIELEEARLGVARTPPKPCSAPSSPVGRSTPPPRSARAFAALVAGTGPQEEAAMVLEGPAEPGGPGMGGPGPPVAAEASAADGGGPQLALPPL